MKKKIEDRLYSGTKKILFNKNGTVNKHVYSSLLKIRPLRASLRFYPKYWVRNGIYCNLVDNSIYLLKILDSQKLKYKTGNSSPKSGIEGDYIEVSRIAFSFIHQLIFYLSDLREEEKKKSI